MLRREVSYRGRVQGVGFRFTAVHIARGYAVVGYVQNLADGTVELVAEGPPTEVERFTEAIAERMRLNIQEARVTDSRPDYGAAGSPYQEFGVRYR